MQPTVGRIVQYKLADYDAINSRRRDAGEFRRTLAQPVEAGDRGRTGNHVREGDVFPAVVVRTFGGTTVNLQVLLDGNDTYWATSRMEGTETCQWSWPERVPEAPRKPSTGLIVHYVSHGTPVQGDGSQAYTSECRAAVVTAVAEDGRVSLCVLNPAGVFFRDGAVYDAGSGVPGNPDCPNAQYHGTTFRYCECGWMEPMLRGGTWHWPERG